MPRNPLTDPNWASSVADTVERVVGTVRDKTTKPLLLAYRGAIFGVVALFGGLAAVVLLVIALTRGLQAVIEWPLDHTDAVWISYLGVGVVFTTIGAVLMRKRYPAESPA